MSNYHLDPVHTIAAAEARAAELPPRPDSFSLSRLLAWVRDNDPSFRGKTDEELFAAGYGDREEGLRMHGKALLTAEDELMRAFCVARIARLAHNTLAAGNAVQVPDCTLLQ